MMTDKSFWLPKIPSLYGFLIVPFHFLAGLYPEDSWNYWQTNILLTILYILLNIALAVYLCRFCDRGAEPLRFAAVHWGLIFLSGLLYLIVVAIWAGGVGPEGIFTDNVGLVGFFAFVFILLTMPLYPFYALFPCAAPVAVCVYAGLLTFFFVRGLYRIKHPQKK